jgi:hypothetical protein
MELSYEIKDIGHKPYTKKCPEIPQLNSYTKPPQPTFWNVFPRDTTVGGPNTPVAVITLQHLIGKSNALWTALEKSVAAVLCRNLAEGTKIELSKPLGEIHCKNVNSATRNGEIMTDTIAAWIKKKFVTGPFDTPPLPNFRVNMLMAKEETTKVRPILNLSAPQGI